MNKSLYTAIAYVWDQTAELDTCPLVLNAEPGESAPWCSLRIIPGPRRKYIMGGGSMQLKRAVFTITAATASAAGTLQDALLEAFQDEVLPLSSPYRCARMREVDSWIAPAGTPGDLGQDANPLWLAVTIYDPWIETT